MGTSNNILSYEDIRTALDRAIASPTGVRIVMNTKGAASHLRHRLYKFRSLDRKRSERVYPEGDIKHGTSVYDALAVEQVENILYIKETKADSLKIEDLPPGALIPGESSI